MPIHQARFITACQQLLALGVVLAVLTPAASVLSLDVVAQPAPTVPSAALMSAEVAAEEVEPEVTEYELTPTAGGAGEPAPEDPAGEPAPQESAAAEQGAGEPGAVDGEQGDHGHDHLDGSTDGEPAAEAVVSAPVDGFGAVGVTWEAGEDVTEQSIDLQVRTREGAEWGEWTHLDYQDDHMPDPGSPDAAGARPGTDALIVGDVDEVQVKAGATEELPEDLTLAVVQPGEAETRTEAPELVAPEAEGAADAEGDAGDATEGDALVLQAASRKTAPQPTIFSRAQWGADERIRNKKSLRYGTISAGFVHHTVNANNYTADQVPSIIRSIYAYHVKSRGWSDIGYNFLVDRFGRIWEGRYGGIDKAVVGAHTLGYNDYAFAMSAIGNFEVVQPPAVMVEAYGALFAWKLGLHGVDPTSSAQTVGKRTFPAINGHRDAGSTACPGKYLYAQLPAIRTAAAKARTQPPAPPAPPAQTDWGSAPLQSNLAGSPHPDLFVRRAADGRGFVIPTGGLSAYRKRTTISGSGWDRRRDVFVSPDLTGDGIADLAVTKKNGVLKVRPGTNAGRFAGVSRTVKITKGMRMFTAVGDINGDGRNDLVARTRKGRGAFALLGTKRHGFARKNLGKDWGRYVRLIGVGDITSDGRPDLLGRDKKGKMFTRRGLGDGTFAKARRTPGDWSQYNQVAGGVDLTGDGRTDLVVRKRNGRAFLLPGRGNRRFGHPVGPLANIKPVVGLSVGEVDGQPGADLVGRVGGALVMQPNRGTFDLGAPIDTGLDLGHADLLLNVGDWDRDGLGDVMTRHTDGTLHLRRGNGQGQFHAPLQIGTGWSGFVDIAPVGDVTGDGWPDLVGRLPDQPMRLYRGHGAEGFQEASEASATLTPAARMARASGKHDLSAYDWVIGISDAQLGQATDVVVRERGTGRVYLINGSAKGLKNRRFLGEGMEGYDLAG